ncbi:hypothetical protein PLICRDRAFT_409657 [Plicaturopsis crispa FD-325 SS-3]|nr:hypothetical protein PLICRDRAFT_409657 [Plicaturopsis crispa FD-325 SS-3]
MTKISPRTLETADHERILQTFRAELSNDDLLHPGDTIGTDDSTLLRFLRARKYDLKESKKMWAECIEWRRTVEKVGIDELYRQTDPWDYPERQAVFKCWPLWFHKTDKKGRPLNIHSLGGLDLPTLYAQMTPERHWHTMLVNAESLTREVLPASSRAAGRCVDQVFVIVDLKGFGLSQFWQMRGLTKNSFQISQDYYPETLGQLAIINAPSSFAYIWSFIKQWLSPETAQKIDVLGGNYRDVLLELIDEDNFPAHLGGSCRCEHAGGCELSGAGPWLEGRVWEGAAKAGSPLTRPTGERVSGSEEADEGSSKPLLDSADGALRRDDDAPTTTNVLR